MALMVGALYDALKDAGVADEKARKAADEVAGFDNWISGLEGRMVLLQWMVGTNIALTITVLWRVFSLA